MNIYRFTLVLRGADPNAEDLEDRLFEAGCDDALVCSYNKTVYLEFDREASSAMEAIRSAIANVQEAGYEVATVQESGVASMSDIAQRAHLSRAAVNNYAKARRGAKDFPEPVYGLASGSPLYRWPEVASWLHAHGKLPDSALEVSLAAKEYSDQHHIV